MSKGWLAALAAAVFAGVWFLTRPAQAGTVSVAPVRGPMPTTPNSAANANIVATGHGLSGTDYETLAVGGGIAAGLTAVGMPLPVSVTVARVLAQPATSVVNGVANFEGLGGAPPLVKGAVGVSTGLLVAPVVVGSKVIDWLTGGPTIVKTDVDDPTKNPQFIDDTAHPQRVGRATVYPQIANPNWVRYPKTYPGLKVYQTEYLRSGATSYSYITDEKAAVIGAGTSGNPPPVLA